MSRVRVGKPNIGSSPAVANLSLRCSWAVPVVTGHIGYCRDELSPQASELPLDECVRPGFALPPWCLNPQDVDDAEDRGLIGGVGKPRLNGGLPYREEPFGVRAELSVDAVGGRVVACRETGEERLPEDFFVDDPAEDRLAPRIDVGERRTVSGDRLGPLVEVVVAPTPK